MIKNKIGKLIVIEGTDGSGKATQSKLLIRRLKKEGYAVKLLDFPQYGKPSCGAVEKYLKALYIHRFDDAPPPIHDVLFLWKKLQLPMTEEKESDLVEIKTFNVEARYDIHKHMLYKKATEGYTKSFMEKIEAMILLIEKEL